MIFALTSLVFSLNAAELQPQLQEEIERAQTWYAWGRDANNPQSFFNRSRDHYARVCDRILRNAGVSAAEVERIKSKASQEDNPGPSHCEVAEQRAVASLSGIAAVARLGFEQSEWRIDNAWDSFRSRYPGVWWLIGEDPTLELVDDKYMNAFGQAWDKLAVGIPLVKVPRLPFIVRCHGRHSICGNYRDELHGATAANPRLHGIPDDRGRQLLGADWDRLIASDDPETGLVVRLGQAMDAPAVMVVDVRVADEFGLPSSSSDEAQYCDLEDGEVPDDCLHVARTYMTYQVTKMAGGKPMAGGEAHGVAVDTTTRTQVRMLWGLFWLLVALGFGLAGGLRAKKRRGQEKTIYAFQLIAAVAAFLVGGFVGWIAGDVSGNFAPDWAELGAVAVPGALEGLPRPGVLLWPIVHGLVVMVGPALLCAFVAIRYLPEWAMAWNTRMDTDVIVPAAQAGAVATLFAPLLAYGVIEPASTAWGLPWELQVAGSIAISAVLTSVWLSRSMMTYLDVENDTTTLEISMLVLGLVLMALLLPLGLFQGRTPESEGWHGLVSLFVSLVAIAGLLGVFSKKPQAEAATDEDAGLAGGGSEGPTFSLNRPLFYSDLQHEVLGDSQRSITVAEELAFLKQEGGLQVLVLESVSGVGKSRTADYLRNEWEQGEHWKSGYGTAQEGDEPYALIQTVLDGVGLTGDLSSQEAQMARSQQLAEASGELINIIPGGGLLTSLTGGGAEEGKSQERIIHDIVRKLNDIGEGEKGENILLVFDDVEQADESSWAVLKGLLAKLKDEDRQGDRALAVVLCVEKSEPTPGSAEASTQTIDTLLKEAFERPKEEAKIADERVLKVKIPKLNVEEVGHLLANAGVDLGPSQREAILDLLHERSREGKAFYILEIVRTLKELGHIVANPDEANRYVFEDVSAAEIDKAVPKNIYDGVIQRLKALDPEERLVLHCASICGRSFSVTNIARGLSRPRLEVLRILQQIEDEHGFIEDVVEDDDRFRFLNTITIGAMEKWLEKTEARGGHGRELVKEMHREVARKMIEARDKDLQVKNESDVPLGRIAFHCQLAGPSMLGLFREYTAQAAIAAARQGAWPEVFRGVGTLGTSLNWTTSLLESAKGAEDAADKIGEELSATEPASLQHRQWGDLGPALRSKLDLAWARACHGTGGQENRDRARRLLKPILDAAAGGPAGSPTGAGYASSTETEATPEGKRQYPDLYPALALYLEVTYEEEQLSELEALIEETQEWLSKEDWGDELWQLACRFYHDMAMLFTAVRDDRAKRMYQKAHSAGSDDGAKASQEFDLRTNFLEKLLRLEKALEALPSDRRGDRRRDRRRDLLRAKMLAAQADQAYQLAKVAGDPAGPVEEQRYNERMEKALGLLGQHQDHIAVAQLYMDQAERFLELSDSEIAQRYLEQAEKTLTEIGSESGKSRLKALQGRCKWAQGGDDAKLRAEAFELSMEASNIADDKSRERDQVLAGAQMIEFMEEDSERIEEVNKLFEWCAKGKEPGCLVDSEVWKEFHEGDPIRTRLYDLLRPLDQTAPGWAWMLGLKLAQAQACQGRRGQENRDLAREWLSGDNGVLTVLEASAHWEDAPFDLLEPVSLYCSITYAEKQASDLDELIEKTEAWLADPAWGTQSDGMARIVTRFYLLMASAFRDEWSSDRPRSEILSEQIEGLAELEKDLEQAKGRDHYRARYRARMIRERAWAEVRLAEDAAATAEVFNGLMEESRGLSDNDEHPDLLGQAANFSMRGDFALSYGKNHDEARRHFRKTREFADKARYEDSRSKLYNRQARCAWYDARGLQRGTAFHHQVNQAFRLAWQAWEQAVEADRERDQIHASINLMEFWVTPPESLEREDVVAYQQELLERVLPSKTEERTLAAAMDKMGQGLNDSDLWKEIYPKDILRSQVRSCLDHLKSAQVTWPWIDAVDSLLKEVGEPEA